MVTYSENFGTYLTPYMGESQWDKPWKSIKEEGLKQLSFAFTGTIGKTDVKDGFLNVEGLDFLYGLYGDYGHMYKNAVGVTLGIRYTPPKKH